MIPDSRSSQVEPAAGFALREVGWLTDADLPGLAGQWLADGFDGPCLRELAGITGGKDNTIDAGLWRAALGETGINIESLPVREVAAVFLARAVMAGEVTERSLCHALWPEGQTTEGTDRDLEEVLYAWDELLDLREQLVVPAAQHHVQLGRLQQQNRAIAAALAEGDIRAALDACVD